MSELKPCPFCGEQVFTPLASSLDDGYTRCGLCGAKMQHRRWQTRPIEDELNRRIAKAKDLLNAEMYGWREVEVACLPDHYLQIKQVLDVLDGGGE